MRPLKHALLPVAALIVLPHSAHASDKDWGAASDIVRDALLVAAVGVPAARHDWNGALEGAGSVAVAGGEAWALKETFPERRPDGSDRKSFPSGHTAVSFAAAASLQNRYGWKVGLPAQAAAAFVGLARVEAHRHHWYDVVVGAGLGEATGFLITRRHDSGVVVFPWADSKSAGVDMAMRF